MSLLKDFKRELRFNRGRLTKMDDELKIIFICGSDLFKEYSLREKHIGVAKMADIAKTFEFEEQDELVKGMNKPVMTKMDKQMMRC